MAGFLEASLLGWFITNPENWTIPEILPEIFPQTIPEIIPEIIPETMQYTRIIAENIGEKIPEIPTETWPEILPEILSEIPEELKEKEKEKEITNWKTIALLGLILGVLMYAVIKHNTALEMSKEIDSSGRSDLVKNIVEDTLDSNTIDKLLEKSGHFFEGGAPTSNAEAAFKNLTCPNEQLLKDSLSILGSINRNMTQVIPESSGTLLPEISTNFQIPINTATDLMNFIAYNKETFTNVLGDTSLFTPIISS